MKNVIQKINRKAVVVALAHFLVSLFSDRIIFRYAVFDFSDLRMTLKSIETIGVKLCFLLLLLFLWQGIFRLVKKADAMFKRLALGYFLINMLLLLFIWPGIWRMDEFGILSGAVNLIPKFWQNYLTSVFYIFSLMLIPIPAGVVICQTAIISLLAAHVLSQILQEWKAKKRIVDNFSEMTPKTVEKTLDNPNGQVDGVMKKNAELLSKNSLLLLIPLVMLPTLDSNLYPMRMNIWAFLELTLLSECYFLARAGKGVKNPKMNPEPAKNHQKTLTAEEKKLSENFSTTAVLNGGKLRLRLAVTCVLAAVVTMWRTEAVYYLILFPILLLLIKGEWKKDGALISNTVVFKNETGDEEKKEINKKTEDFKMWKYAALYILCFLILAAPQKIGEKMESGSQYELTGMVLPLVPLIKEASDNSAPRDITLLERIDPVINVEVTLEGEKEGKNGINLFWGEPDFQRDYNEEEFAAFRAAYYQLVLRYPAVFLRERLQTFTESHDLLMDTTRLFSDMENPNHREFSEYPLSRPLSENLRNTVISILELRNREDYADKLWAADHVYSAYLPILVIAVVWVVSLVKKRWVESLILFCSLAKVALIFLTAPSRLFMYYYPVYLFGYFLLFYCLWRIADRKCGRMSMKEKVTK